MCFFPICFTISTAEVGIIEKWGKYDRLAKAGCHIVCAPMDGTNVLVCCYERFLRLRVLVVRKVLCCCIQLPRFSLLVFVLIIFSHSCGICLCYNTVLVGTLSFRVQELNVRVESKTLDNVFLTATVSVQYCILAEKGTFHASSFSSFYLYLYTVDKPVGLRRLNLADFLFPAPPSDAVTEAFYELTNPKQQITAHVYDGKFFEAVRWS